MDKKFIATLVYRLDVYIRYGRAIWRKVPSSSTKVLWYCGSAESNCEEREGENACIEPGGPRQKRRMPGRAEIEQSPYWLVDSGCGELWGTAIEVETVAEV